MNEKTILRARDFWTSVILICTAFFFLHQTMDIPFLNTKAAGVDSAEWYNSAALIPYAIFGAILVLALSLMAISIKDGGARYALKAVGLGVSAPELLRTFCISCVLFFYIFGLVPRVDFIIASSLMITCLVWGFHAGDRWKMLLCAGTISSAGLYAMIFHFPLSEWVKPHDDDWITLILLVLLTLTMLVTESLSGQLSRVVKITPVLAIVAPLTLIMAMAFGFRQNVPNRTGLIFSQIEYHYYVSFKPIWNRQ